MYVVVVTILIKISVILKDFTCLLFIYGRYYKYGNATNPTNQNYAGLFGYVKLHCQAG